MGTKNNPGAFDCYANAEPDEPMFVLLGRDKHAPALVYLWAMLREFDQEPPDKVAEARDCVEAMIQWQLAHGRKSIGVGHATLVGVMGLIRAANLAIRDNGGNPSNNSTSDEDMLRMLHVTLFDTDET